MKEFTWGDYILVHEELFRKELSNSVLIEFDCGLGVREVKFPWSGEEFRSHQQTFIESVEVSSFITEFGEFSEYNSSNKALFRAKGIGKCGAWVFLENSSK